MLGVRGAAQVWKLYSRMIGMILVTHGQLAEEFVKAMEHVVGRQEAVATVCIGPKDDVESKRKEIAKAIKDVDGGEGVAVLTDLFGGTPSNLAISLMKEGKVEVVAGINLPMLIRLANARKKMGIMDAVKAARDAGRNYITIASEYLGQEA
jgi:PTS system mannose-specific IIA component